jgi:hypothetical protein
VLVSDATEVPLRHHIGLRPLGENRLRGLRCRMSVHQRRPTGSRPTPGAPQRRSLHRQLPTAADLTRVASHWLTKLPSSTLNRSRRRPPRAALSTPKRSTTGDGGQDDVHSCERLEPVSGRNLEPRYRTIDRWHVMRPAPPRGSLTTQEIDPNSGLVLVLRTLMFYRFGFEHSARTSSRA